MKIINTHDKYFKEVFSKKAEAISFLKGSLDPALIKNLDLDSLTPLKDTYIDEDLKEYFSDLVFTCRYKGKREVKIVLLFEHKSKPVEYPHLQLLKYLLKIWENDIKQKRDSLTPVVPIIFYHGKEPWNNRSFHEYFKGADNPLEKFLPSFDYLLTDLSKQSDEEIRKRYEEIKTQTALLLMKNIMNESVLRKKIPIIFMSSGKIIETEEGVRFFSATLYYIYNNIEQGIEEITKEIETISTKGGDIAMTIAMQLEQKGIQKGFQKGKQETQKEVIVKLFTKGGFSIDELMKYLELERNFVETVLKEAKLI